MGKKGGLEWPPDRGDGEALCGVVALILVGVPSVIVTAVGGLIWQLL